MADHKHGDMDIEDQQKTFDGFVKWTMRSTYVILATLVILAIVAI